MQFGDAEITRTPCNNGYGGYGINQRLSAQKLFSINVFITISSI
jgi:hypothetical protein